MMENAWLIPLIPLFSSVILLIFGKQLRESAAYIGILAVLVSFICSVIVLVERIDAPTYKQEIVWLVTGEVNITAGFEVTALNTLLLVMVSLVSCLVQIYSKGYMEGEKRFSIFYTYLGFFTFAMLGLVLSPNLLQLYFFWELVGLGSFLLIGFYFYKKEAKEAAKKAFIMTRIGDLGLLIAIILLFWKTGSFDFQEIFSSIGAGEISGGMLTLIALLLFAGAVGKSGQFPLHSWLPDAMEGPTPVSALIHAATMVAAGVYLVAVTFPIFSASSTAMETVAVIGGFTAIFAASIALVQKDIKRILAYSTISQLGYMMLALGTAGYTAGIFHLLTHAFFKALLFLAAGSIIHAIHTQDIYKMGGLWKKMRLTSPLFLIGALSISGVPLLSGFFSKDEILVSAWVNGNYLLFWIAMITAFLTSFYVFRLFFLIFTGQPKTEVVSKESPFSMVLPMGILGIFAVCSGYIQTPWFGSYLGEFLVKGNKFLLVPAHSEGPAWIMAAAAVFSLSGILLAYLIYVKQTISRNFLIKEGSFINTTLINKYFIDETYYFTVGKTVKGLALFCSYIERFVIGGFEWAVTGTIRSLGSAGARLQSGQVQVYGVAVFAGLAVLVIIYALTGGLIR
ncbi:NADH-quinone oxidoreductase subunit L [Peribacillus psychrosaccharolyticus]|uniref:NADH-quinone oxidoreductase subunit L n=1 Tax=Peribacillus psychrosaccharolyticus TaxID=1407 RepID=UPI003D2855FA